MPPICTLKDELLAKPLAILPPPRSSFIWTLEAQSADVY